LLQRALVWLAFVLSLVGALAHAGDERYDYDALGRLIRVIDEQGRVTEYVYDPAGNLLQVLTGTGGAQAPSIASIAPARMRRGETRAIQISGTGLTGAHVSVTASGLSVSNLSSSATLVNFTLAASAGAPLGAQAITVSNAGGTATTSIAIDPVLPTLGMSPLPIALPPAGTRNFFVSLSNADGIAHVVNLASANAAIATVSPASVTFAAGVNSSLQLAAGRMRGRVMALYSVVFLGSTPIGAPIAGWLAEVAGPRAGLLMGAAAALLAAAGGHFAFERAAARATGATPRPLRITRVPAPSPAGTRRPECPPGSPGTGDARRAPRRVSRAAR